MRRPRKKPSFLRVIMYFFESAKLVYLVKNWLVIPLGFFRIANFKNGCTLHLRNGLSFKIYHSLEALTLKEIFYDNDYKLRRSLRKCTIIDIGANIGGFAIFAASINPNSQIFAYEPSRRTFKQLEENISKNRLRGRIFAVQKAVGGKKEKLNLYDSGPSGTRSVFRTRGEKKFENVSIITLNDLFKEYRLKKCDFLKIDCEGGEYDILQNTKREMFSKIRQISLEFHEMLPAQNHQKLVTLLRNAGYKVRYGYHKIENNIGYIYAKK